MSDTDLTLILINNSSKSGHFSVRQAENGMEWLQKAVQPTTHISITWNDQDYGFAWQEVQTDHIQASQYWPADLNKTNHVTFKKTSEGYTFADQVAGTPGGVLTINVDGSAVASEVSVGIGMAGAAFLLYPSSASSQITFSPKPMYWVVFSYPDATKTTPVSTTPEQVIFPAGVTSMTGILNKDMTWVIKPTD